MNSPARSVLVTGASGLLGRALVGELRAAGLDVRGAAYRRAGLGMDRLDLRDLESLGIGQRTPFDRTMPGILEPHAQIRKQ